MALFRISFYSNVLGCNKNITVSIPQKIDTFLTKGPRPTEDGKIPVLWLLHGMGDDFQGWQRYTGMEKYCEARGIAVVVPEVDSLSFYSDMVVGLPYLTYLTKELPAIIHEFFPQLSQDRRYNYIAGNSMGGNGAIKIGLLQPERFSAIGIFSSGNLVAGDLELPPKDQAPDFMMPMYMLAPALLGKSDLKEGKGTDVDIFHVFEKAKASGKELPRIIQYAGTKDWILSASDKMAAFFQQNIGDEGFTYEKWEGFHDWTFWDQALPKFLDSIGLNPLVGTAYEQNN